MATHSSILAWKIPRTEKPARLSPRGRKELAMTEHTHTQCRATDIMSTHAAQSPIFYQHSCGTICGILLSQGLPGHSSRKQ